MKNRVLSLLLAFALLFSNFSVHSAFAMESGTEVTVYCHNPASETTEEAGTVELYHGGEIHLSAEFKDTAADIQWQIEAEQDFWVDIQGCNTAELRVSYGMVNSLLRNQSVRMRCAVSANNERFYSAPVTISVTDTDPRMSATTFTVNPNTLSPDPLPAPTSVTGTASDATPVVIKEPSATEQPPAPPESTQTPTTNSTDLPTAEPTAVPSAIPTEVSTIALAQESVVSVADSSADPEFDSPDTVTRSAFQIRGSTSDVSLNAGVNESSEEVAFRTITIEYVYADISQFAGQRVALPYIAEVAEGNTLTDSVISPTCVGYVPDFEEITINFPEDSTTNYTVSYSPADVSYTVRHYQQNIADDEYSWVDTTVATGKTESLTSNATANSYTGFTALSHYHEKIAPDSSTMIDIYYDRNYYLMSFDLDGGYGVAPIYARYGADISIDTPYKPGYTFAGWNIKIPDTMPAENQTYTAKWKANSGISFTVAYWLEDPNTPGTYDFWTSANLTAEAGSKVNGEDYKEYANYLDANNLNIYDKRYSYYDHADSNVQIKGDGTTVVNVYYNRNEYTLKFYYAAHTKSGTKDVYKIFGGSTYYFGQDNGNSYNGDEMALLNAIYQDKSGQWGTITEAPKLNAIGLSRGYTSGSDTKNNVDYLFVSFTAKYGADISELWPCNVFEAATRTSISNNTNGWKGTAAYVSAWNGEHHVYYSQHNSNETIKGNYNELDYQLLFDQCGTHTYTDSSTVAYLCFWENGSGSVSWNVPKLFRYNIFVPLLDGQNTTGLTTKRYNGVTYCLRNTYDTCDNSTVAEQTAPAINGYTFLTQKEGDSLTNPNSTKYSSAYNVDFYYSRDRHDLIFMNGNRTAKKESVFFETGISGKAPSDLEYHNASLKDMYIFDGWYTTPDAIPGTEVDLSAATMPDSALTLYAKWQLISHDVKIHLTEADAATGTNQIGTIIAVTHDQSVPEESRPDETMLSNGETTFIGWFYKDENGKEQAFDFATMTITQDMTIYAKWRSNVMKQVEIHYMVEDENDNRTQIAASETLMLHVGQTRTFEAKTGNSLYVDYRTGCFPTIASHSITPVAEDLESSDPITWTFVYKEYGAVPYQVEFYVQETDGTLRPAYEKDSAGKAVFVPSETFCSSSYDKTDLANNHYIEQHWQNDRAVVIELYVPDDLSVPSWTLPDEYIPSGLKVQTVIVPSSDPNTDPETDISANVIQFIYRYAPVEQIGLYSVNHYIQNPENPDQCDLYRYKEHSGAVGETVTGNSITIPGYTYSSSLSNANKQPGNTLTEEGGVGYMSGNIISADTLELNFYYTVNSYPYQVMFLEKDTSRVLLASKTRDEDGNTLTARYGSAVTELAEEVDGYDVYGDDSKTIYIQMEGSDTASVNTIVFYYTRKSADLVISKTVALDEEQAKEEGIAELPAAVLTQEFLFTITCPTGFHKSVYDCTVTNSDNTQTTGKITAGTTTMTFTLQHGQTIAIHDLAMGSYSITETYVPGFRTSVDGTIQQTYSAKLETANQTVTANFLNSYPFYTGDLVLKKNVTKYSDSDPDATEPYTVQVVLNPDKEAREVDRVITWTDGDVYGTKRSFTIPAFTSTDDATTFTFDVLVPVNGEVTLKNVPSGSFAATEAVSTTGYVTDYYKVSYNKTLHRNDEVSGTSHIVNGVIHGGHPTDVTFTNAYKKGSLIINKTVIQEYAFDDWQGDTFTFTITGTTELPDGEYTVSDAKVNVQDGVVSVKDKRGNDPVIVISKTDGTDSWSGSLSFEGMPAGYYTVSESSALGLDKYVTDPTSGKFENLLVNSTATPTEADFINTYKQNCADLTISTTCEDSTQSFVFSVSAKDTEAGDISLHVVLVGNDSQTIKSLPFGTYTVTELSEWSWRENEVRSREIILNSQNETVSFDFESVDRIYWLNGCSYSAKEGS